MSQAGIIIKKNINKRILHDKFIVIDKERVISGSYNFTEKANSNNENIILAEVPMVAKFYARLFEILTNNAYIDESIELLLRYPAFAQ
jgi:phosphatidylserine/phosphatidylglycerophosphate/cardiolipin synthase-like enzyme